MLFTWEGALKNNNALKESQNRLGRFDKAEESKKYAPKFNTFASKQLYLDEIGQFKLLTREEETELGWKAHSGDLDAIRELVEHNLRLVVYEAQHFEKLARHHRVPMEDVYQNGNVGLWMAAKAYTPVPTARFATYARRYIRQQISRGIWREKAGMRIPTAQMESIQTMRRLVSDYRQREQCDPTDEEIVVMLREYEMKKNNPKPEQYTLEKVQKLKEWSMPSTSLDKPVDNGKHSSSDQTCLGDFIGDEASDTPEEEMTNKLVQDEIEKALNKLSEQDQAIIRTKWLNKEANKTQNVLTRELCKKLGVTTNELFDLEKQALANLGNAFEDIELMKQLFHELMNRENN